MESSRADGRLRKRPGSADRAARRDAALAAVFNTLIGLWLVATPLVLGYEADDAWWNPMLTGLVITSCASGRLLGTLTEAVLSRVNLALGLWLIGSAAWLSPTSSAGLSNATCGVLVVLLALLGIASSRAIRRDLR